METFFLIVLLGLIHCQSLNETVSRSFEPPDEELSHKFINGTQSESLNFHFPEGRTGQDDAPHEFEFEARNGEEPQAAPSTTLSRIVQTKYGKVQGLSLTLFSNYGQKVSNHPLRNKIVEVRLCLLFFSWTLTLSLSPNYLYRIRCLKRLGNGAILSHSFPHSLRFHFIRVVNIYLFMTVIPRSFS